MGKQHLELYDTTLRDGAQTSGVDFTLSDKLSIINMLDDLGINIIEAGYPGANPLDTELFENLPQTKAEIAAFGMTKRHGRSAHNDSGLQSLLNSKAQTLTFVAKAWDFHILEALQITLDENLLSLEETIKAAREKNKKVIIDCEHFFDGFKANPNAALALALKAHECGASTIVLCDTNGGTLPHDIAFAIRQLKNAQPNINLGIHTHNDTGHAIANTLAAIENGATHIQGTLNGLGERCGNADFCTLIPILLLKEPFASKYHIDINEQKLTSLTHISRKFDEIINRASNKYAPFVGENAFAHKGGIHASAVLKNPDMYEHINPQRVGNTRKILISDQAGKSNILAQLQSVGLSEHATDLTIEKLLTHVKEKENQGYAYEAAEASFKILALKTFNLLPDYFSVEKYWVNVEHAPDEKHSKPTSQAIVKLRIGSQTHITAAEGNGPVNALDAALRKDLGIYQTHIKDLELIDYKVRILNGGTQAITRVLLESRDGAGHTWTTIGVSTNIIEASFEALVQSIQYKLYANQAKAI